MTRDQLYFNFINNLKIRTRDLRLQSLSFNEPQRLIWEKFAPRIRNKEKLWAIILKARREGVSTFLESLMTARTFIEDLVHAKVIAHIADSTATIWEMASLMVRESKEMKSLGKLSAHMIQFGDSELTVSTAGSEHATRGMDLTCGHLSEVAFWERPEAMLAILQCFPQSFDSWVFIESTANGKTGDGELFYNEWKRAEAGESDFIPIFLPWYAMSEYNLPGMVVEPDDEYKDEEEYLVKDYGVKPSQLAWRRMMIRTYCQGDVIKFHQEYPSFPDEAFIASGLPFFTTSQLAPFYKMIEKGKKYIIHDKLIGDPNGYLEIFRRPEPEHQYVIGADSSMGFEDDDHSRSAFQVVDMETLEQVAEYDCSSAPHIMAKHLAVVGRYYNEALLCPEVQASGGGGGREIIVYLRQDHKYYNLHQWKHGDKIGAEHAHLVGWETNSKTRPRMVARLREAIMERTIKIHSSKLLSQLANFGENETGRLEAVQGHDDLLFAFGIALVSRSENYVAKHVVQVEEDYDLAGFGIKTVGDTSRMLEDHRKKILAGIRHTAKKDSYLEY